MATTLPWDWYNGAIPDNVILEDGSFLETSFSLAMFRSRSTPGLWMRYGASAYLGTMFDVGSEGVIEIGRFALLNSVRVICDARIDIGDHALISWNVVLMDSYREPMDPWLRRQYREGVAAGLAPAGCGASPIHIGPNVWIGFDACILPGVCIGEGAIVGARSVVRESVPPYSVAAGNPARVIRTLKEASDLHGNTPVL